jgi:hypothetical protein
MNIGYVDAQAALAKVDIMEHMSMDTADMWIHAQVMGVVALQNVLSIVLPTFQLTHLIVGIMAMVLAQHAIWLMVTAIVVAQQQLYCNYSVELVHN